MIEKKILEKIVTETDELINECYIALKLSQKGDLTEEEFKDFLYRTKDTYSKYFDNCKLVEGDWMILKGSVNASIDVANFYKNDVTQTLMEICLSDLYQSMKNIEKKIKTQE